MSPLAGDGPHQRPRRRRPLSAVVASIVLLLFAPYASVFSSPVAPDRLRPMDSDYASSVTDAVRTQMSRDGSYGLAVMVVRDGRTIYARAFGERRAGGPPVDLHTHFEIGSDTKQFTAAAILQLKEAGKLAFDDSLAKYVPDFPHANEVTLRQLLDQTTGLFDYVSTNHFLALTRREQGDLPLVEDMVAGPLAFRPGSQWAYSNTNYFALARVVEVTSGENYKTYLRRHIFAPADMGETGFVADERRLANMAVGYWRGQNRKGRLRRSPTISDSWLGGAGDIVSTVGDLAKWDLALERGTIVSRQDLALMTEPATLADDRKDDYGFGWWIDPVNGHTDIYHDGDTLGMSSSNNYFPDYDLWIVVLEDQDTDSARRAARAAFAVFSGYSDHPPAKR